jgi:PAS domain S-box-containing protein
MNAKELKTQEYAHKLNEISETLQNLIWKMIDELRESEQRYRYIVEFAADAIITMSKDTRVTSWNKGATAIFGYSEEEALGKPIDSLIARDGVSQEAARLSAQVLEGVSLKSLEAMRYTKAGEPRHVLISAAPITNDDGDVEEVSLIYKDITELKQAHEQLVRTEKQATLGIIAGSIGHELNNLIGGLLLHARLLKEVENEPDKVREIAEVFCSNLEKVALHGKNLLSLSRPTKPRFEPMDLNAVINETTDTLILTGVLKHFKVVRDLCTESSYVYGDRNLLEQLIRNLEINAAHAMKMGGHLEIRTRLSESKDYCEISIADDGCGIPKEAMDKIFLPFYTTKSEGQGTGLGLPIVKDIVEKHNGTIRIESVLDKGTRVQIGLPVAADVTFTQGISI